MNMFGKALAGHAFRVMNHKKKEKYDNPLTDMVNLIIAQVKADQEIKTLNTIELGVQGTLFLDKP